MLKDWNLNNNKLTPPNYHLQLNQESKKWLINLNKAGIIYEQTGDYSLVRNSINVGLSRGFINEAFRYKHRVEAEFQLPQELTDEGISERNIILKRLAMIKSYFKLVELISIPILMCSTINISLSIAMSIILYQFIG